MKRLRKAASDLLGFDRRERRATFVLAVILLMLLLMRVVIPGSGSRGEAGIIAPSAGIGDSHDSKKEAPVLFLFDPNTASAEDLMLLGLSERQASTLINYRNAGARFRKPGDLYRVYGIDSLFASTLIPWVSIEGEESKVVERSERDLEAELSREDKKTVEKTAEKSIGNPVSLIDLNRCSAEDLVMLPGIGAVLSVRIIKYRDLLGGFVSPWQLYEVYGLDSATVDLISVSLKVSGNDVKTIDLDTCSWSRMARHPYLGSETARAIMKYRTLMGTTFTVDDLVRQRVISEAQAARMAPYVSSAGGSTGK